MITNIKKLKEFGIFKNFQNSGDCDEFSKYNLFYGWNGSGKTTLTKLFSYLESNNTIEEYVGAEFKIETDGPTIDQNNYKNIPLNARVFNEDFVAKNIDWNNKVNSILIISEEKISEKIKLDKLIKMKDTNEKKLKEYHQNFTSLNNDIDSFLITTAKNTKEKLEIIDTNDTYFLNYNKRKFKSFIDENHDLIRQRKKLLNNEDVKQITKSIRQDIKPKLNLPQYNSSIKELNETKDKITILITKNVVTSSIDRLKDNPEIATWVENGIEIHTKYESENCEYCGQSLPHKRIKELKSHFSDEFKILKKNIDSMLSAIDSDIIINLESYPDVDELYPEFQNEYAKHLEITKNQAIKCNSSIQQWQSILGLKYSNPFDTSNANLIYNEADFNDYKNALRNLCQVMEKHNTKTDAYSEETNKLKNQLESHYTCEATKEFDYFNKVDKQKEIQTAKFNSENYIKKLNDRIIDTERNLSDEHVGATKFNIELQRFIGHNELSLKFEPEAQGYRILRREIVAKNLSEGEKRAIAFVYFIMKLKENDNSVEDTIIVIDDPVSSFDSNNLFSAYSFLKAECENAKQLFIFTHNFNYFRLIRDWLKNKNKKNNLKTNFYVIECVYKDGRIAEIKNANESLIKYNSEYHYLFSKLYSYKEKDKLDLAEALLVANLSRKLLEAFLTFKHPRSRNDFKRLMEDSIQDKARNEKVYHFINKYSHNKSIDVNDFSIDNLFGESQNIVQEILTIIEELDKTHYDEMIMSTNN